MGGVGGVVAVGRWMGKELVGMGVVAGWLSVGYHTVRGGRMQIHHLLSYSTYGRRI